MFKLVDYRCAFCGSIKEELIKEIVPVTTLHCIKCKTITRHERVISAPNIHVKTPDPARRGRGRG